MKKNSLKFFLAFAISCAFLTACKKEETTPANNTGGGTNTGGGGTTTGNITTGLITYYPFDGNANNTVNSNILSIVNGLFLTSDKNGKANSAYEFSGIKSYIDIGRADIALAKNFTISIWAKPNKSSSVPLMSCYQIKTNGVQGLGRRAWEINVNEGKFGVYFADLNDLRLNSNDGKDYADGKWHHFVTTYNGIKFMLYVDNNLVAQRDVQGELLSASKPNIFIGHSNAYDDYNFSFNQYFRGAMDEVRIYNRSMSAADIDLLYKSY
jgi:hypothetical protein